VLYQEAAAQQLDHGERRRVSLPPGWVLNRDSQVSCWDLTW